MTDTLPLSRTAAGSAGLAALAAAPERAVVAVDYDGTLAPIVADPNVAVPHPQALPTLARLSALVGQVAVVTGRPVQAALEVGGFAGQPGLDRLVVLGLYGHQRWEAATGRVSVPAPSAAVERVRAELPALLARLGAPQDTRIEDKGGSLAVHVRGLPAPDTVLAALRPGLEQLAAEHGLQVEPGRLVLELREPGVDKGAAVRALAGPGTSALLYCGDDLGDLAAFTAVEQLREQGVPGVTVCASSPEAARVRERADVVVDGVPGLVGFLAALADTLAA